MGAAEGWSSSLGAVCLLERAFWADDTTIAACSFYVGSLAVVCFLTLDAALLGIEWSEMGKEIGEEQQHTSAQFYMPSVLPLNLERMLLYL